MVQPSVPHNPPEYGQGIKREQLKSMLPKGQPAGVPAPQVPQVSPPSPAGSAQTQPIDPVLEAIEASPINVKIALRRATDLSRIAGNPQSADLTHAIAIAAQAELEHLINGGDAGDLSYLADYFASAFGKPVDNKESKSSKSSDKKESK